jgi:serine protease
MRAFAAAALAACALAAHAGPRLIVQFDSRDVEGAFSPATRVAKLARDTGVDAHHVRRLALGAQLFELPDGADARAAARELQARGGVAAAFPDRHVRRAKVPNDTLAENQWYLTNDEPSTNAYAAWDVTTGSPSVVVAVVDTGILAHPDLAGRILPGYDFISDPLVANDGDGRDPDATDPGDWVSASDVASGHFDGCGVEDSSWHGTNTAGIVAANGNNAFALAGMDWGVRILPLRVLGKCGGDFSDIFDAIAWAAGMPVPGVPANPHPAHVVNLSLGEYGDPCTAGEDALLASLLSATGLRAIVAAAGNDAADANGNFPSSCPSTIAVTATSNTGDRTIYSNYGTSVDLAAPGGDRGGLSGLIYVLSNFGTTTAGAYAIAAGGGTSYAAPMVVGVISLMLSVAPDLTPAQVRTILTTKYKPFPAVSRCTQTTCGKGLVDARAAVLAAQATLPPAEQVSVVEYFHAGFGHYFMTADPGEIAGLDAGAYGGAFVRTGRQFNGWSAQAAGTVPVCRFFTTPGTFGTKSSHFHTANPAECDGLKLNPNWIYEKIAFYIAIPTGGVCPGGTIPVYRMYNNGQTGAPNHRFTTDLATYQQFTSTMNWSAEGVAFCASP